jgi:hypothetical protein
VLAPEAEVLRIEALRDTGDSRAAAARAREFLTRHPDAPQARHVRSILEAIE